MEIDGFEATIAYEIGSLRATTTYSRSRSALDAFAEYTVLDGARIDREQGDTFGAGIAYNSSRLGLIVQYEALVVDSMNAALDLDGATQDNSKDGYTVHNVWGRWSPGSLPALALTLGVENLFDEFYASQSSRTGLSRHPRFGQLYLMDYEPGRNIKGTLSYRF
jgi:hemoglobin/transferrin/lactoferrin receptor protein